MTALLVPFFCLAVVGLVLSIIAHLFAVFGLPQPLGSAAWSLHVGIFVVWLPAVLVSQRLVRDFKQKDFWKAALRGCPVWMRWMTFGFFGYAFVNFALFIAHAPSKGHPTDGTPAVVFRGFSGHWMAFYSAAAAILYSAIATNRRDSARRCPNNHPVPPAATFCEECGSRIDEKP